jgi:hypothetical protein
MSSLEGERVPAAPERACRLLARRLCGVPSTGGCWGSLRDARGDPCANGALDSRLSEGWGWLTPKPLRDGVPDPPDTRSFAGVVLPPRGDE